MVGMSGRSDCSHSRSLGSGAFARAADSAYPARSFRGPGGTGSCLVRCTHAVHGFNRFPRMHQVDKNPDAYFIDPFERYTAQLLSEGTWPKCSASFWCRFVRKKQRQSAESIGIGRRMRKLKSQSGESLSLSLSTPSCRVSVSKLEEHARTAKGRTLPEGETLNR